MKKLILLLVFVVSATVLSAQDQAQTPEGYIFTDIKSIPVTSVKNQASSGTCWSFSTLAYLESEILVAGGPETDLSPMFVVRNAYYDRAVKYVRMHGTSSLSGGAASEDVLICWRKHGIVPTEIYGGNEYGEPLHRHAELDATVKAYCDAIIKNPNRKLSTAWLDGLNGILNAYLGEVPATFTYNGVEYTPKSYAASLPIDIDNYVSLSSFTHHPFYEWFVVEVPDNTVWGESFNVPLAEMMSVIEGTLDAGYPVEWSTDVSDKGFAWRKGIAVVPDVNLERMDDSELARWVALSAAEKDKAIYTLDAPGKEREISQEMRQEAFDNWETTDDHGMELVGLATDQVGNRYFKVKNSWGADDHIYSGYLYASRPFVEYKTISVLVNRHTLPKDLAKKLSK
jgi:bleomycin hydrolase